jgi:phage terminase large subunit GpA-like protein
MAARVMKIHYDERAPLDEIRDMAVLLCPTNGCLMEDSQRYAMNLTGKWYGRGQTLEEDGTITGAKVRRENWGWWIVGAMSTLGDGGIGELAETEAKAVRKYAVDRDREVFRSTIAKNLGELLEKVANVEDLDATVIAERSEDALVLGRVAHGVRFITVMIDVQLDRFELMARGWCEGGRSVVVDFRVVPAAPSKSAADWDKVLKIATETVWPMDEKPGFGMTARLVGFDSAGQDGVTLQTYDAWRRLKRDGKVRSYGKMDGRPVFSVLPLKGGSKLSAPRLQVVFPDGARSDRSAGARGDVPVGLFNPNLFKNDLNGQLLIADGADWAVRFPRALAAEAAPHPWFEQLVAEHRLANGQWDRIVQGRPNEALDLMVGTHVLAFMLGIQQFRWSSPPPWARLDGNPQIVALPMGNSAGAAEPAKATKPVQAMVAPAPAPGGRRLVESVAVRR